MKTLFQALNGNTVKFVVETTDFKKGTVTFENFDGFECNRGGVDTLLENIQGVDGTVFSGNLKQINEIQVLENGVFVTVLKIVDIDRYDGTFVIEIQDKRIVQVQFDKTFDRLNANYGLHIATIDYYNDYGYNLSEEEDNIFGDWLYTCKKIQDYSDELDEANEDEYEF